MENKKLLIVLGTLGFLLTTLVGLSIYVYLNVDEIDIGKPDINIINNYFRCIANQF